MSDLRTGDDAAGRARRPRHDVIDLRDDAALQPAVTGGKAAALAQAVRAGIDTLPGVVLTTRFSQAVDRGQRVPGHPAVQEAFGRAGGDHQSLVARSSSVRRGHGRELDGRSVRLGHRHRGPRGVHLLGADRARLTGPRRRAVRSDRRARAAARHTRVRRRAVRRRPRHRPNRPPRGVRGRRWTRAARERARERFALPDRRGGRDPRARHPRRPRARSVRPAPARGALEAGGAGLRLAAGRRVGDRPGEPFAPPAVATRHHRAPRCAPRPDLRTGPRRRDVPRAADRARARPVGAAPARRGARGGAARRHRIPSRRRGVRGRRVRARPRRHRPAPHRRHHPPR